MKHEWSTSSLVNNKGGDHSQTDLFNGYSNKHCHMAAKICTYFSLLTAVFMVS